MFIIMLFVMSGLAVQKTDVALCDTDLDRQCYGLVVQKIGVALCVTDLFYKKGRCIVWETVVSFIIYES